MDWKGRGEREREKKIGVCGVEEDVYDDDKSLVKIREEFLVIKSIDFRPKEIYKDTKVSKIKCSVPPYFSKCRWICVLRGVTGGLLPLCGGGRTERMRRMADVGKAKELIKVGKICKA